MQISPCLQGVSSTRIVIEGDTLSEGTEEYNKRLSRRSQAVVADLVRQDFSSQRLSWGASVLALGTGQCLNRDCHNRGSRLRGGTQPQAARAVG